MFLNLRMAMIKLLAGNEPILMGWRINSNHLKGNISAVYIPLRKDKIHVEELKKRAVLTPLRNEI